MRCGRISCGCLLELEVRLEFIPLAFRGLLVPHRRHRTGLPEHAPNMRANLGRFVHHLREDVLHAGLHFLDRVQMLLRIDQRRQQFGEIGDRRITVPNRQRERLKPLLAGRGGQALALRLERQIKILKAQDRRRIDDLAAQFVGQLPLILDAAQDRLLALVEVLEEIEAHLNLANCILVEAAGSLLAIARDKGDGVSFIEELHHALHLHLANLQILSDARTFKRGRFINHDRPQQTGIRRERLPWQRACDCELRSA